MRELDMTTGQATPLIIRFSVPILLTSVLQQLYSLADGVMAGRFLGIEAFAAVSAAGFIAWLPQNMLLGLTHGFGVALAQLFGAGDRDGYRKAYARSAVLSGMFALLFVFCFLLSCQALLTALHLPSELQQDARGYLTVIYAGLPVYALFHWSSGVLRAMGDSRTPFLAMAVSSVINIVLDYVLLRWTLLGAVGIALTTVISQLLALLYCLVVQKARKPVFPQHNAVCVDGSVKHLLYMGLMPMLRDGVIALGGLFVQRAVNGFGVVFVAGMAAANRYFAVISMSGSCFEGAVATYSGQNFGAGKMERIQRGVRSTLCLSMALAVATMIIFWIMAPRLIRFITGPEEAEVLHMGVYALRCMLVFLPALHALYIYRPAVQGMGHSVAPMLSGFAELGMRLLSVICFTGIMGHTAACIADGLGWVLAAVLLMARYGMIIRKCC